MHGSSVGAEKRIGWKGSGHTAHLTISTKRFTGSNDRGDLLLDFLDIRLRMLSGQQRFLMRHTK